MLNFNVHKLQMRLVRPDKLNNRHPVIMWHCSCREAEHAHVHPRYHNPDNERSDGERLLSNEKPEERRFKPLGRTKTSRWDLITTSQWSRCSIDQHVRSIKLHCVFTEAEKHLADCRISAKRPIVNWVYNRSAFSGPRRQTESRGRSEEDNGAPGTDDFTLCSCE